MATVGHAASHGPWSRAAGSSCSSSSSSLCVTPSPSARRAAPAAGSLAPAGALPATHDHSRSRSRGRVCVRARAGGQGQAAPLAPDFLSPAAITFACCVLLDLLCIAACTFTLARCVAAARSQAETSKSANGKGAPRKWLGLRRGRSTKASPSASASAPTWASLEASLDASLEGCPPWLVAVMGAAALSNLCYKLCTPRSGGAARLSVEAAARLARIEAITEKQLADFQAASRQVDKLQTRTRLTAADVRGPLKLAQSQLAEHGAVLVKLAEGQTALQQQVKDTQQLLLAMQGLVAKQFMVTTDAIKQLKARAAK